MAEVQKEDKELQDLLNRPEGTSLKLQPMQFQNSNLYCDTSTAMVPQASPPLTGKPPYVTRYGRKVRFRVQ
ncbi:hypothetical protein JTE90_025801 [Oedothorax gibbosus]|uniref:Uncharacterized protein n=1 Tax=Oedothorax gibbosus TaxID=931172 RepID=A0AAV6U3K3_9ARAC|nr:hypothetical protein JTE90_025801 [Oedothorax gibbosus]